MDERDDIPLPPLPNWTLLSSHGLVLLYVAVHPDATVREISHHLELTNRRVADLIRDLAKEDFVRIERKGRRNHYTLVAERYLRHPLVADVSVDAFVEMFKQSATSS